MDTTRDFKVVLLGEGSVGKTSLFSRFMLGDFDEKHNSTLQAMSKNKRLNLPDGRRANIALWDTAGQERFHSLGPIYYRDSHGAVLVYDITDRNSFVRVQNWVKELRKMLGKDIVLAIAGNKIDLEKSRSVSLEEAEAYAKDVGAEHYSTSAKLNKGINEMFTSLSTRMFDAAQTDKSTEETVLVARPSGRKSPIVIDDSASSSAPSSSSGNCCS